MPRTRPRSLAGSVATGSGAPARDARAERQREYERLLVTAPCRHHMHGAVCDQCVPSAALDSLGFPKVDIAGLRGRYRLCAGCRKLWHVSEWRLGTDRCQRCSGL
jgi:hypothetical protein